MPVLRRHPLKRTEQQGQLQQSVLGKKEQGQKVRKTDCKNYAGFNP